MRRTRAFVLAALVVAGMAGGCGGDAGTVSEPVSAPQVLRLVATPSVGSVDHGARVEAVVAYPERVTQATWKACVLLVDDPASATCPIPTLDLGSWTGDGRFATQLYPYSLQSIGDLGTPLLEALAQVQATHPELLGGCAGDVVDEWTRCTASEAWPDQCTWSVRELLSTCILQGGATVRVQFTATLDDGSALQASRRLRFEKSGSPAIGNRNPVLFHVEIDGRQVSDGETIQVPVGTTLLLRPSPFELSAETYTDDVTGQTLTEQLSFAWVRTGGDLDADNTTYDDALNTLFVPESALGTSLSLWVFFEDNRGGIDWTRVGIDPVPTP